MIKKSLLLFPVLLGLLVLGTAGKASADTIWSQVDIAKSNIDLGELEAAQAAVDKLLTDFSESEHIAQAVHEIAGHYRWMKKYEKSKQLCQYVIDNWPGSESAMWSQMGVAMAEIALDEPEAARAAVDKLVADFSGNKYIAQAVSEIAGHCRWLKKYQESKRLSQYVVDNWPDSEQAMWAQMGVAMAEIGFGEPKAAQAAIDKLVTDFSTHKHIAQAVREIAEHCLWLQKHEKAEQLYQYVIDSWPGSEQVRRSQMGLAMLNIAVGDSADAELAMDKLIADFGDHPDLPNVVLQIAEPYYDEALRKETEGLDNQAKDSFQKALAIYEMVKNRVPGYVATADTLCWTGACYRALGEYEKSIECYQKVVDDYPSYHMAWNALFLVGRNYEELKKSGAISPSEADPKIKAAYQQLLEKYPDSKPSAIAQNWLNKNGDRKEILPLL